MKRTSSGHFCPSLENLKAQKVCFYLFISYFSHKPFQLVTTFSYLVLHDLWLLVIFWLSHVLHFDHCYYSCPNFVKNRQFPKMLPLNCIWLIDYHVVQWFFFFQVYYIENIRNWNGLSAHALEIEFRNTFGSTSSSSPDCVIVYSNLPKKFVGNLYDKGSLNSLLS